MTTKRSRLRGGALPLGATILVFVSGGIGGWYARYLNIENRFAEQFQDIAENLIEGEQAPSWPPAQEEVLEPEDAGPILPVLPPPREGFQARDGQWEDIVYIEAIFGEANFDDALPTIVLIHGRGGRAELPGGPFWGIGHAFRVVVPQAPDRLGQGFQWIPVYVGQGLVDRMSSTLFQAAGHVADMLRYMRETMPMVGKPIVTGFSQGGIMTITLAIHHDDVVGVALPLACWLPPPLEPPYQRQDIVFPWIRAMHGIADPTVPIEPTRELFARLEERGFEVDLVEFDGAVHAMNDAMNDLFHDWLEAAVCFVEQDLGCLFAADVRAAERLGRPPPEPPLLDAGPSDARPGARLRRDASPDANPEATEFPEEQATEPLVEEEPAPTEESPGPGEPLPEGAL